MVIAKPGPSVRYDVNEQRLDIDVPQAWVMKNYQNYVDPSLWENGINAAMLSYNLNGYHSETPGRRNDSIYAAFRALSMDAVQKANSGHPGAPMGMADIAEVLWNDFLKHNPTDIPRCRSIWWAKMCWFLVQVR